MGQPPAHGRSEIKRDGRHRACVLSQQVNKSTSQRDDETTRQQDDETKRQFLYYNINNVCVRTLDGVRYDAH